MNPSALDWELCRSFLAILREGSMTGAARRLNVAHPTIRRHLDALETAFSAPLFVRSPSGLAPTELAQTLRSPAEAMESAFEHLVRSASGARDLVEGTVRITASHVMGVEVLPPMLKRIKQAYPSLAFELDLSDAPADVLRRDADIAVRMFRPTQTDLIARRIATVRLGLFAHREWLKSHELPRSLKDLLQAGAMIGADRRSTIVDALKSRGMNADRRQFHFRSDSDLAQLGAMRAGLGVAVCQLPLAARDPALVQVLPQVRDDLDSWLVGHPNLRGIKRIAVCMDALADELHGYAKQKPHSHAAK